MIQLGTCTTLRKYNSDNVYYNNQCFTFEHIRNLLKINS